MSLWYSIIDTVLPFQWLEPNFMKNALLAILVAAPLFGALGSFVVSNKMSFFSDAIGHSALTGIAFGVLLGIRDPLIAMVGFSLILGFAIITVKTRGKSSADTIIGVFSSTSVALGIVLLSATGNFARYQKYLIGDILSITPQEILLLAVVAVGAAILWIAMYNKMLLANLHRTLAKSRGIRTVLVTRFHKSPAANLADVVLRCGSNEGPFQFGSVAAKIAQLVVVDVLFQEYFSRNREICEENIQSIASALSNMHI